MYHHIQCRKWGVEGYYWGWGVLIGISLEMGRDMHVSKFHHAIEAVNFSSVSSRMHDITRLQLHELGCEPCVYASGQEM